MELDESIEEIARCMCDETASAIETYAYISGGETDFPESFVHSYVLINLGRVLTMTAEVSSRKLWVWNLDGRRRWDGESASEVSREPPAAYVDAVGQRRADLVMFKGDYTRKQEADFLCISEFKKEQISPDDVVKLQKWLGFIDTCPYGIVWGYKRLFPSGMAYLEMLRGQAEQAGDMWVLGRVARPRGAGENFQTFARVLRSGSFRPPANATRG